MKLKQFISSTNTPAKLNQLLSREFGFKISDSASSQQLEKVIESCTHSLTQLRQNGKGATTAEYAEQLLIKEAAQKLLKQRIIIEDMVGPGSNVYRRVMGWLTDYACRSINVGDSFDVAIKNALREYRSSPYRFPEIEVEHDLRKAVKACYSDELAEPLALEDYQASALEEKTHPNSKIYDKCWSSYRKVPGKKRGEPGSCRKETPAERALRTSEGNAGIVEEEGEMESVELDEAIKIGTTVTMHAPGKDYHNKVGLVREIRRGPYKGAPKTYTVEYEPDKKTGMYSQSIQLPKSKVKIYKKSVDDQDSPVFDSIARRISVQRLDLVRDYGIEQVMSAIRDVASFVGDVEEIGSSDVSIWVKRVEDTLNPKFKGKSQEERIKMAKGSYYGQQNENTSDPMKKWKDLNREGYKLKYRKDKDWKERLEADAEHYAQWKDLNRQGYKLKYPNDWKERLEADAEHYAQEVKDMYRSRQKD